MDGCHYLEIHLHHQLFVNLSGSLGVSVAVRNEKIGDTQITIRVDIINDCSVCKGKMCIVHSFLWCYYMVVCYYLADYTYEDPDIAVAAPA